MVTALRSHRNSPKLLIRSLRFEVRPAPKTSVSMAMSPATLELHLSGSTSRVNFRDCKWPPWPLRRKQNSDSSFGTLLVSFCTWNRTIQELIRMVYSSHSSIHFILFILNNYPNRGHETQIDPLLDHGFLGVILEYLSG